MSARSLNQVDWSFRRNKQSEQSEFQNKSNIYCEDKISSTHAVSHADCNTSFTKIHSNGWYKFNKIKKGQDKD